MLTTDFTECYTDSPSHIIDGIHPITGLTLINGETFEQIRLRYPNAQRVMFDEWLRAKGDMQNTPIEWDDVPETQYRDMLEVLPPIMWTAKGFLVGEPDDHCARTGRPRYRAYRHLGSRFLCSSRPLTVAEWKAV